MSVEPISPEYVASRRPLVPDEVINVFNELIQEKFDGKRAVVAQDKAVDLIVERMAIGREMIFRNKWLDVEPLYREAGWLVEFDKPGYNEDYTARFVFTKP